ncbi:MAG TPA: glycosyltransferase family 39 protein [Isosphaeraceae bacterium]|nr:glycosyltransferase family 39 protein [Isosphaeraceae bacterium]
MRFSGFERGQDPPNTIRNPQETPLPTLTTLTWAVVGIGVILRATRYGQNAPLWWNEAFVAVNFLDRTYLDLLKPLDYGQVCPLGFLWIEKTIVGLFGFAEWSLRLYPLLAGIGALILFARLALRVLTAPAAFLAVSVLAMAYHPIRLCSEAKPYASDLLAAVVVLWVASGGREKGRLGSGKAILGLSLLAPVLIFLSHPVVFVLGGVWCPLALERASAGRRRERPETLEQPRMEWPVAALGASIILGFGAGYALYTRGQSAATLEGMRAYWKADFPPLSEPWSLPTWLTEAHTGRMMAYPVGGAHGGSVLTFGLVLLGVIWLRKQGAWLAMLLLPFALTLLASALQRHPYGSHPRIAQHLAPAISLLTGAGLESLRARITSPGRRQRVLVSVAAGLLLVGIVPMAAEWSRPYRSEAENRARAFARKNWSGRTSQAVSLRGIVPGAPRVSVDPDVPLMLCNLKIADPNVTLDTNEGPERVVRPTRFLIDYSTRLESPEIERWKKRMMRGAVRIEETDRTINLGRGPRRVVCIEVRPTRSVVATANASIEAQKVSP